MPTEAWIALGVLALIIFIAFCIDQNSKPSQAKESLRHPKLLRDVHFLHHSCGELILEDKSRSIRTDRSYKHPELQGFVKAKVEHLPLNTTVRITNLAWEILPGLQTYSLVGSSWEPIAAYHHGGNVVMIRYGQISLNNKKEKTVGDTKDLFLSTKDGHIIDWYIP